MKAAFAIASACVLMLISWSALAAMLVSIAYLGSQAGPLPNILYFIHFVIAWIVGPGFGGFVGTFVACSLFEGVSASTILTGFVTTVVVLAVCVGALYLVLALQGDLRIWDIALVTGQVVALVIGARLGKAAHWIRATHS